MTLPSVRIHAGDALDVLRRMPAGSARCCVTSPPYWGLRDYGEPGQLGLERTFPEYVARLVEVCDEVRRVLADDGTLWLNLGDCYATGAGKVGDHPGGGKQGARWRGEGSKQDLAKRSRGGRVDRLHAGRETPHPKVAIGPQTQPNRLPQPGLKPKDLVGMPWRVAFALQEAGWWLRADVVERQTWVCPCGCEMELERVAAPDLVWAKPNPTPESVRDRPTRSHEYLFLLAKRRRYYYDRIAASEPLAETGHGRRGGRNVPANWYGAIEAAGANGRGARTAYANETYARRTGNRPGASARHNAGTGRRDSPGLREDYEPERRQLAAARALARYKGLTDAHLAALRAVGLPACPSRTDGHGRNSPEVKRLAAEAREALGAYAREFLVHGRRNARSVWTIATQAFPEAHFATFPEELAVRCIGAGSAPGDVVLDPFAGSGTVGAVALELGRSAALVELNPDYVDIARRRCEAVGPLLGTVEVVG